MITIEETLDILKKDKNFREILDRGEFLYDWTSVSFDKLSYDSRDVSPSTLFFVKGAAFKKEFLELKTKLPSCYALDNEYDLGWKDFFQINLDDT